MPELGGGPCDDLSSLEDEIQTLLALFPPSLDSLNPCPTPLDCVSVLKVSHFPRVAEAF